jgi:hypothetical protein
LWICGTTFERDYIGEFSMENLLYNKNSILSIYKKITKRITFSIPSPPPLSYYWNPGKGLFIYYIFFIEYNIFDSSKKDKIEKIFHYKILDFW